MTNDPRDLSGARLQNALRTLGRNIEARKAMLKLLRQVEDEIGYAGPVRDDVTGPVIEALHEDSDVYEKTLADGTRFRYLFRTKIARDFLMSDQEHPSHVWEPQTTRLMLHLAKHSTGDTLVGGAYFGDQAVLVARAIQARGDQMHCFEPNPEQSTMLQGNADLNQLGNLRVNRVGLWSESSKRLKLEGFDSFANTVEATDEEDSFETVTIDDYVKQVGRRVGLIQIDIEGAEYGALLGAKDTLASLTPHIVFEVHRHYVDWSKGLENTDICRYLAGFGYALFAVRDLNSHLEMGHKPIELVPVDKVYLDGPPHGFNMVAVRDRSVLEGSMFRVVEHVSPKLLPHKDPALHHPLGGF